MNKLSLTANIISIISGFITILGIGGIVSWSLSTKDRGPFQRKVAAVLAFSLKTAFCIFLLGVMAIPALTIHAIMVGFPHNLGGANFFWDSAGQGYYIASYIFQGLLLLPLYLGLCFSIYEWSFDPFKRLWKAIKRDKS